MQQNIISTKAKTRPNTESNTELDHLYEFLFGFPVIHDRKEIYKFMKKNLKDSHFSSNGYIKDKCKRKLFLAIFFYHISSHILFARYCITPGSTLSVAQHIVWLSTVFNTKLPNDQISQRTRSVVLKATEGLRSSKCRY